MSVTGRQRYERSGSPVNLARLQQWDIVVAPDATLAERYAAAQLQHLLHAAGAPELPLVDDADRGTRHIFVGPGGALQARFPELDPDTMGGEEFRLLAADDCIVIAGGRPRGTLYGVYSFVEDFLGVRFLTADHTYVPAMGEDHMIGPGEWGFRPALEYRGSYSGELSDAHFGSRLRFNALIPDTPELGGLTRYRLINHSVQTLLPSRAYGEENPEWYALRDGVRRWDVGGRDWGWEGTQPCFSNPAVIETITANTLAQLQRHPEWRNVSVSQNDNNWYCECDDCASIDRQEASHMGALLRLVNHVADAVAVAAPGTKVGTLAYLYSRVPPAITRPRDNVQIQLCSFEACQLHALDDPDCPANVQFLNDLKGWSAISEHIYIWHYVVAFRNYLVPCANYFHIGRDIRTLVASNVKGLMAQGAWNQRGAEFAELRNYIIGNMMWDPDSDTDHLMHEFLTLHYGAAAGAVRELLAFAYGHAQDQGGHARCALRSGAFGIDEAYVVRLRALVETALAQAETEEELARVEKLRIMVPATAWAVIVDPLMQKARSDGVPLSELAAELSTEQQERLATIAADMKKLIAQHGITGIAEESGLERFDALIKVFVDDSAED